MHKLRRFDGYEYAPLEPGYPDPQQRSYHFAPKPMEPQPPICQEQFRHWFHKQSWQHASLRRLSTRPRFEFWNTPSNIMLRSMIPKRDTALDEGVPENEDFWGLYIMERRSRLRATFYSLILILSSVYFFFAWIFQWRHASDLQNASVPLVLSLSLLGTFWGSILMTSLRFEGKQKVD